MYGMIFLGVTNDNDDNKHLLYIYFLVQTEARD